MMYRIEYAGGKCSNTAYGRKDLLDWLKILRDETVTDIKKLYKNGASEIVTERYGKYIRKEGGRCTIF